MITINAAVALSSWRDAPARDAIVEFVWTSPARPISRAGACSSPTTTTSARWPDTGGAERALERAASEGWTVTSMRDDWETVWR
jgi:hypothetical protein